MEALIELRLGEGGIGQSLLVGYMLRGSDLTSLVLST